MRHHRITLALLGTAALAGCGGGTSSAPPAVQALASTFSASASQFTAALNAGGSSGQAVLALATGDPTLATPLPCGVSVYHYSFNTVDGQGQPTTASAALMLPTGSASICSGARPMLEYAHGTNFYRSYNLAALGDSTNPAYGEATLIAAMYAANGYIVVAPNYEGYDTSTLSYHPYLVGKAQSQDMIDALAGGRAALSMLGSTVSDDGKLFLTGYSQGGYVALATEKAMQQQGMTVTAASPGSGPYALEALVDYIFLGHPDLGAPQFGSLLVEAYQASYGNIYSSTSQVFANNLYTPLPYPSAAAATASPVTVTTPMFSATAPTASDVTQPSAALADAMAAVFPDTVPPWGNTPTTPDSSVINQTLWTGLFDTTGTALPSDAYGAGFSTLWSTYFSSSSNYLINPTFRANYLADVVANPDGLFAGTTGLPSTSAAEAFRQDLAANDLRGYKPTSPTMLCGGSSDPIVYYPLDTGVMQQEWGTPTNTLFSLDVDPASLPTSGPTLPFKAIQQAFQAWKSSNPSTEVVNYHGTVGVYCAAAAREFFAGF